MKMLNDNIKFIDIISKNGQSQGNMVVKDVNF
jgi:hypothetical protein